MENILNAPTASDDAFDQYVQCFEMLRFIADKYDFLSSEPTALRIDRSRSFKEMFERHYQGIIAKHYIEPKLTMTFDDLLHYGEYDA